MSSHPDPGANHDSEGVNPSTSTDERVSFHEVAPAAEFACWIVVALAPFLRWANGAAVTDDQFVIQIGLTALALGGALSLRFYNYRSRHRR
jgi:hypothetical protein